MHGSRCPSLPRHSKSLARSGTRCGACSCGLISISSTVFTLACPPADQDIPIQPHGPIESDRVSGLVRSLFLKTCDDSWTYWPAVTKTPQISFGIRSVLAPLPSIARKNYCTRASLRFLWEVRQLKSEWLQRGEQSRKLNLKYFPA